MDHLDVEFGAFESGVVEAADVVEEVAGEGTVGVDGRSCETEVVLILRDLFVDGGVVNGDRSHRDFGPGGAFGGEEAAVDVVVEGGRDDVAIGGDELDAGLIECEGGVAVVGDDDADGNEAVLDVFEPEEAAVSGVVAGLGGDSDLLVGMSVEGDVLVGRFCWRWCLFVGGKGIGADKAGDGYYYVRNLRERVGLHGQLDYHLRWGTR